MELTANNLTTLFDQLGLPSEGSAIDDFIEAGIRWRHEQRRAAETEE